jgi:NAD(P)-dependent dehydrogenase (short-subunit alcohol dehydrogenase family)
MVAIGLTAARGPDLKEWLNFKGKTVVITGAAAGIGRACAEAFADAKANVVLADIDAAKNRAASEEIAKATGAATLAVATDVSHDEACAKLIDDSIARFGRIDVLINNAAIVAKGTILDLSPDDFDRVLDTNLRAAFVLTQLAAKDMVAKKTKGAIINMSSLNAQVALPNQVAYVTSKGGIQQLTKTCALGLAEHGIRVNAIGPGSILTDILRSVANDAEARRGILARTPLGRIGGPEEIASIALFLASDMASYMTAEPIFADGGRLALNYTVPVRE